MNIRRGSVITFCFLLIYSSLSMASSMNRSDVSGVYKMESTDPVDPGGTLIFLDDGRFVASLFFGVFTGSWKVNSENVTVTFTQSPAFALYGRSNKSLEDKFSLTFRGFGDRSATVNFNAFDKSTRARIFNSGANCLHSTYDIEQTSPFGHVEFGQDVRQQNSVESELSFFTFYFSDEYNDFLIVNYGDKTFRLPPWTAKVLPDGLGLSTDEYSDDVTPLKKVGGVDKLSSKEMQQLESYFKRELAPSVLSHGNKPFPYISPEERTPENTASFYRIEPDSIKTEEIENFPESHLFTALCEQ